MSSCLSCALLLLLTHVWLRLSLSTLWHAVRALSNQFEKDDRYMDLVTPTRALVKDGPLKKKFSKESRQIGSSKVMNA